MNNYIVYMHISPSGKRYVGITSMKKPEYRWNNGNGYKNNKYFTRAIEKYGWDNFEHIIIAKDLSEEEAKWLEIELIREWNTTNREKGYNITLGGEGTNGWIPSEEAKKKISESKKGKNNFMYGKTHTEEAKKKMSEARKGKIVSEEIRKKMSEANKGKNNPNSKSIICLTTNKIFEALADASRYYNIDNGSISYCCRGKRKSAGKLSDGIPLVWMYLEDYEKVTEEEINKKIEDAKNSKKGENNSRAKAVVCITTNKIFFTVKEGAEYYNCNTNCIVGCCKGRLKSAGKLPDGIPLVWRYIEIIEL